MARLPDNARTTLAEVIPRDLLNNIAEDATRYVPDALKGKQTEASSDRGASGLKNHDGQPKQAQAQVADLDALAGYIRQQFQRAMISRNRVIGDVTPLKGVDNRFIDCMRRRKGVYDSETSARIAQQGGTARYAKITLPKINAALARLTDVLKRTVGLPYSIKPPPVAELPEDHKDAIRQELVQIRELLYQQGHDVSSPQAVEAVFQMFEQAYDRQVQRVQKEADERADRMQQYIERQLDEAGWDEAIREFLQCFVTYMAAFIKGPYLEAKRVQKWQDGKMTTQTIVALRVKNLNPQDAFPCPNSRCDGKSWFIELVRMDRGDLAACRHQPGYNAAAVEKVLTDSHALTLTALLPINEPLRAALENRDPTQNYGAAETDVTGLEYWGPVEGKLLKDWRIIPKDADEYDSYQISAIVFGEYCVKAVLNPHPLGLHPYRGTSWCKLPGDVWQGLALCEIMDDIQDNHAATVRALVNNLALASGPMLALDKSSIDPANVPDKLVPWMRIWFDSKEAGGGGRALPIVPIKIDCNAQELMAVASWFKREADDRTGIPDFAHGGTDVKGAAGDTASGMNMFLGATATGAQQELAFIDEDIFCPTIKEFVRWNNENLPDEKYAALKGDYIIEARGYLGRIVHEELQRRRMMFSNMTNNPYDREIMSVVNGRVTLLRVIAKDNDIPVDDLVPTVQQYQAYLSAKQAAMSRVVAGGPGEAPAQAGPVPGGMMPAPASPKAPESIPAGA